MDAIDPVAQFEAWLAAAEASEPNDPNAIALATVDASGMPNARMVLLKEIEEAAFVFYTNYESRKARELAANGRGALLFHWDVLGRQVRVEGRVARLATGESAAYFATRPRGSQLAAWASRQSEALPGRADLEREVARLAERFEGADVPLPPHWGGFRLLPDTYEFWQHREDRLHDRIAYEPDPDGSGWRRVRLAP